MMFLFPLAGIILLITSPHEKWKKIVFAVIAAVYMVISTFGLGTVFSRISDLFDRPVDTSLTREEYVAACEAIAPEDLYRAPKAYEDEFITLTLRIVGRAAFVENGYETDDTYYICEAESGSVYKIIVRDCLIDNAQNFISGDIITVYGEGAGECVAYDSEYVPTDGACVNMAYVVRVK